MVSIGEGAAVEVVDDRAGTLVAALAGAVDRRDIGILGGQQLDGFNELIGGPGVGVQIEILIGADGLEAIKVDGHAVGGHAEGIFIAGALLVEAGGLNDGKDLCLVAVVPQIGYVDHIALGAPVGDQTLGTFHDEVGRGLALNGSVDLIVAVGVGQVLNRDLDAGIGGLKAGDQLVNDFGVAPAADGIGPQGESDVLRVSGGAAKERKDHAQGQNECEKLFHVSTS